VTSSTELRFETIFIFEEKKSQFLNDFCSLNDFFSFSDFPNFSFLQSIKACFFITFHSHKATTTSTTNVHDNRSYYTCVVRDCVQPTTILLVVIHSVVLNLLSLYCNPKATFSKQRFLTIFLVSNVNELTEQRWSRACKPNGNRSKESREWSEREVAERELIVDEGY